MEVSRAVFSTVVAITLESKSFMSIWSRHSFCKKKIVVSGIFATVWRRAWYSVLAVFARRNVIRVVISAGRTTASASRGVTIPRPSSPCRCCNGNDQSPDWLLVMNFFRHRENWLEPKALFADVVVCSRCFFELSPVAQTAYTFARLKPTSFVSTMIDFEVILTLRNGSSDLRHASPYNESSAFWTSSYRNRYLDE